MKRAGSQNLAALPVKKHAAEGLVGSKNHGDIGPTTRGAAARGYGLQSSAASAGADSGSPRTRLSFGEAEVCSPPPTKPLNFLAPIVVPASPFDKAVCHGSDAAERTAWRPGGQRCAVAPVDSGSDGSSDAEREEEGWDVENRQPCGGGATGTAAPTWLFSPVSRGRPPSSAPLAIPSPLRGAAAGLLSPGMPTPARPAPTPSGPPPSLHHAPSFSSWMVAATRPASPPLQRAAAFPDVGDVVAGILGDVAAARRFDTRPSSLDALLARIGDTHYPASVMQWEQEELADSPAHA